MALSLRRNVEPVAPPTDDYLVESEQLKPPTAGAQIAHVAQTLLIVFIALLSFATFWVIALLLNVV